MLKPGQGELQAHLDGFVGREAAASKGEERGRADHRRDDRQRPLVPSAVSSRTPGTRWNKGQTSLSDGTLCAQLDKPA